MSACVLDDDASAVPENRDEEDMYYQQRNSDLDCEVTGIDDGFGSGDLPGLSDETEHEVDQLHSAVGTSSSSWTVYNQPKPKAMATSASSVFQVPPTYERDAIEQRWRLARKLYTSVKNPHLLYPWEKVPEPANQSLWPLLNRGQVLAHDDHEPAIDEPLVKRPKLTFAAHQVKSLSWEVHDDLLRQNALIKWRVLVEENLLITTFGKALREQFENPSLSNEIQMSLQDVFERKSTATLAKRASSLMNYLVWSRKHQVQAPMNLTEAKLYRYVCHMRDTKAAPTAIRAFLESLVFAQYTIGLMNVPEAISQRVRGCSSSHWKLKRPLQQAPPMTVADVYLLETVVIHSEDLMSVVAAGFFLMCIFSCCRFSDAMKLQDINLDMASDTEFGFLETRTLRHKTGNTDERRTTFLPVVSLVWGTHEKSWGERWFNELMDTGLSSRNFVLPAPLRTGKWSSRPLTVGEGSQWLREILKSAGSCSSDSYTVRGLKATGLSWCSKHGSMTLEQRKLLGHHMDNKGTSALTYSRDALAGPLASFAQIMTDIRELRFFPDDSRALRAWSTLQKSAKDRSIEVEKESEDEESSDSDSDSNDMSEEPDPRISDQQLEQVGVSRSFLSGSPLLYINTESGLGHLVAEQGSIKFRCGRALTAAYYNGAHKETAVQMCLVCSPSKPVM